jgi:RNA polymerase sigma factor (TIGR02999 family)
MAHSDVTGLLTAWSQGREGADAELIEAVQFELRRLARGYLRRERPDHSLRPTALVHESCLKLADQHRVQWQNRAHLFAIAAHVIRRIRVDSARASRAAKRGASLTVPLDGLDAEGPIPQPDVLALNQALERRGREHGHSVLQFVHHERLAGPIRDHDVVSPEAGSDRIRQSGPHQLPHR